MNETYPLWIRAETVEDAATQGQAWADAEPALDFMRVVSVEPHPKFWRVWTVTVETKRRGFQRAPVGYRADLASPAPALDVERHPYTCGTCDWEGGTQIAYFRHCLSLYHDNWQAFATAGHVG